MRTVWSGFWMLTLLLAACQREDGQPWPDYAPFLRERTEVVDSLLGVMSLEEKAGQLVVLQLDNLDTASRAGLFRAVSDGRAGGFLVLRAGVSEFIRVSDSVRSLGPLPLLIGTAESGLLNNQFTDVQALPGAESLEAVASDSLRERVRAYFLEQALALGLNFRFGPSLLPAIGSRGRQDGLRELEKLNQARLLSIATPLNDLPLPPADTGFVADSLRSEYHYLIKAGVSGLCGDGAFYSRSLPGLPPEYLRYYLQERVGFRGLIVASVSPGEELDNAIHAGADLFVIRGDGEAAYRQLLAALQAGRLKAQTFETQVRKVLMAKYWMRNGLHSGRSPKSGFGMRAFIGGARRQDAPADSLPHDRLVKHFQSRGWALMHRRLCEGALTLAANPYRFVPFRRPDSMRFQLFEYSSRSFSGFRESFGKYAAYRARQVEPGDERAPVVLDSMTREGMTILLLDERSLDAGKDSTLLEVARRAGRERRLVLVNFRHLQNLSFFDSTLTVVQLYERHALNEQLAAQLLFGAVEAGGRLPAGINESFCEGQGEDIHRIRLQYVSPEAADIRPERLVGIDAIVRTAIDRGAMPGCQVLLAREGKVFYNKSFGYHTYKKEQPVRGADLYDLASVTKVAATTLAAMRLYEEGVLGLQDRLREHLDIGRRQAVRNLTLERLLTHQSGLQPNLPVVPYLLYRGPRNANCRKFFCTRSRPPFTVQAADRFFFDKRQQQVIWDKIFRMPVSRRYRYSDINFVLLQRVIEAHTGSPLDRWVDGQFYQPLNLRRTAFHPLERFSRETIVPTQDDRLWRHQVLRGYVHDEGAALLGGMAGHAGLFSTAEDLAVISQMLLEGGTYGGTRYFRPETVELFTRAGHGNHRGLGFDKPSRSNAMARAAAASAASYGHTGFTGTCLWVDPDKQLVFIFLSNRIHPSPRNTLLFRSQLRKRIHQIAYDAIGTYDEEIAGLSE